MDIGTNNDYTQNFIPLEPEKVEQAPLATSEQEQYEATEKELRALKLWLFSENIRIETEKKKLQELQNRYLKERLQLQEEMRMLNSKISMAQQRLKQDEQFFDKKMEILKNGYAQLEQDRQAFEKEKEMERQRRKWQRMQDEEEEMASTGSFSVEHVSVLFAGVKNNLALKKRYKDLLKIFHPDNVAGDKSVVQEINREYERLKKEL